MWRTRLLESKLEEPLRCDAVRLFTYLEKHVCVDEVYLVFNSKFATCNGRSVLTCSDEAFQGHAELAVIVKKVREARGHPVGIENDAWDQLRKRVTCARCLGSVDLTATCCSAPPLPRDCLRTGGDYVFQAGCVRLVDIIEVPLWKSLRVSGVEVVRACVSKPVPGRPVAQGLQSFNGEALVCGSSLVVAPVRRLRVVDGLLALRRTKGYKLRHRILLFLLPGTARKQASLELRRSDLALDIPMAAGDAVILHGSFQVTLSASNPCWVRGSCERSWLFGTRVYVCEGKPFYASVVERQGNQLLVQHRETLEWSRVPVERCSLAPANEVFPFGFVLLPCQHEFLELLWREKTQTALHHMSTGKTILFLACVYKILQDPDARVVICAPNMSKQSPWCDHLSSIFPDSFAVLTSTEEYPPGEVNKPITWISYEYLKALHAGRNEKHRSLVFGPKTMVLLDELYELKEAESLKTRAVKALLEEADPEYKVAGTGSSFDSPGALAVLALLRGGKLSSANAWKGRGNSLRANLLSEIDSIIHYVGPERSRSEQSKYLPRLTFEPAREERRVFRIEMDVGVKETVFTRHGFTYLQALQEMEFHPSFRMNMWKNKTHDGILAEMAREPSTFLLEIYKWLEEVKGEHERVVLVSPYSSILKSLKHLLRVDCPVYLFSGHVPQHARDQILRDVQQHKVRRERAVVLLTPQTGGIAVNLTSCSAMLNLQADFKVSSDSQLVARIARCGQDHRAPLVTYMEPQNGVSAAVRALHGDREYLSQIVRDKVCRDSEITWRRMRRIIDNIFKC